MTGHNAWLAYRHTCGVSRADAAERGTLAGLIDAHCTARVSAQRLIGLRDLLDDLDQN